MKKLLLSITTGFLVGIVSFVLISSNSSAALSSNIYISLTDMQLEIKRLTETDPQLSLSSNPYSYIKNNKEYERIIKLGIPALPVIEQRISEGPNYGLDKYILAIAAEEIARVNLKKGDYRWSDAEEFIRSWKLYLKSVPKKVDEIVSANETFEWKNDKLAELGTPAIPYIKEKGIKEIEPSLQKIIVSHGPTQIPSIQNDDISMEQWESEHKQDVKILKALIKKASEEPEINKSFRVKN
ncbi:hypothetical protein [Paenibacillus chitinolyticus]|uniref:hypothetical protein n=1 Tax=Paenibacillus chitinolyticus TaxID=79263 RepID=UPI00363260DC